jgi:hypothetical protein
MPTFDGKPKGATTWRTYEIQFEYMGGRYGWDEEELLNRLVEALRDNAANFFSKLPAGVRADYRLLVERMRNRFGHQDPPTTVRRQIQQLQQGQEESLEQLAEQAKSLALDAFPEAPGDITNALAADAFWKACSNKRAASVAMNMRPGTIDDALEWTREAVHNQTVLFGKRPEKTVRQLVHQDELEDVPEVRAVATPAVTSSLAEQLRELIQLVKASTVKPQRRCYGCGKEGHFWRDCPSGQKAKDKAKSPEKPPKPAGATVRACVKESVEEMDSENSEWSD